ncbi:MAG: helix-turn-helix domain-containing protein [Rubrivivax sp.]|nr:MAG: helix-turn-helix domain-containing protein [Rubrivivax sp.]
MMLMNEEARSYSTAEIAKRLGISPQTVQRWVDSGRLKAWKTPGGHRRIDARSAELLFVEQEEVMGKSSAADLQTDAYPTADATNVVIVEDDPADRELVSALVQLALPDVRLFVAGNGFQGLVLIAKWAPKIVITDVHMPHMDGFEMIRNVLADTDTRPQLLIAISAKSRKEIREFGQLPAEVKLFQKPLDRTLFMATLQAIPGVSGIPIAPT